ncbi:MAG: peptidoglycan-binding domain-containing protein [Patescibacteria group bacterium]
MIKKLKLGLLIAVLSLFVGVANSAFALTYSADVVITINGNNYTILSGSEATSIVLDTTTLQVVTPASATFTLISPNRHTLTNNGSLTATCTNGESKLIITASLDVTVTPSTTACGAITSGGGGSGGGGYAATPPADTTAPTNTSVSINAGATTSAVLTSTLTLSATDATQMLISNDAGFAGALWETYATSKTWTLVSGDGVKTVYAKFRDAAGNMSMAVSDTITVAGSGTEVVVPLPPTQGCSGGNKYNTSTGVLCVNNTGPQIPGCGNRISGFSTANGASCVGNTSAPSSTTTGVYNFGATTLKNGSKGEPVKELQRFLNDKLNLGLVVDGKLGPKTIKVIKQWQKDNGLVADGLVGKKTKALMNAQ